MKIRSKSRKPAASSAKKVHEAVDSGEHRARNMPGPSTNPATNLLIADVALRTMSHIFRRKVEDGMLRARYTPEEAKKIMDGRTMGQTLGHHIASRIATKSIPGAILVTGALLGKAAFDRSQSLRKARRKGDEPLTEDTGREDSDDA